MDPLAIIEIAGGGFLAKAAGGAASELGKRAASWFTERFGKETGAAEQAAATNGAAFLEELAKRIEQLETARGVSSEKISESMSRPDSLAMLRASFNGACESDDAVKRDLLASLVADRLAVVAESTLAVAARVAAEAVPRSTSRQLRTLGALALVTRIKPPLNIGAISSAGQYSEAYTAWLTEHYAPFSELRYSYADISHLESLSLLKTSPFEAALTQVLSWRNPEIQFLQLFIEKSPTLQLIDQNWKSGWQNVDLTLCGVYLGAYVNDHFTGISATFTGFD